MKTQLRKPARTKARYTEEYKQEALELWRASGRSAAKVAAELGIRPPLLYRWARAERVPKAPKTGRTPKRRREICPNRTDERPIQGSLVMRGSSGLAQRLLRLERAAPPTRTAPTGKHPLARAHPRGICSQSPDLRQPTIVSCAGLSRKTQPHRPAHAQGATLRSATL